MFPVPLAARPIAVLLFDHPTTEPALDVNVIPTTLFGLQTPCVEGELKLNVGVGFTTRVTIVFEEQAPLVAVTVYGVVVDGLTVILSVLAPVGAQPMIQPAGAYIALIVADCP
jgi:hypothetical protein